MKIEKFIKKILDPKKIAFTLIAAGISGLVNDWIYDGLVWADKRIGFKEETEETEE